MDDMRKSKTAADMGASLGVANRFMSVADEAFKALYAQTTQRRDELNAKIQAEAQRDEAVAAFKKMAPPKQDTTNAEVSAATICKGYIKNSLRAPSTAKFPWKFPEVTVDGNQYMVKSYVDSQNGFGAMLRTNFICFLQFNGGKTSDSTRWRVLDVITD